MLKAGKTPLIDIRARVRGKRKTARIIALLREHGVEAEIVEEDGDIPVNFFETDLYKESKARMTPGRRLRIRRDNAGLTQAALGKKAGLTRHNISDMENGRRPIGEAVAERLAAALGLPASVLQRRW